MLLNIKIGTERYYHDILCTSKIEMSSIVIRVLKIVETHRL